MDIFTIFNITVYILFVLFALLGIGICVIGGVKYYGTARNSNDSLSSAKAKGSGDYPQMVSVREPQKLD